MTQSQSFEKELSRLFGKRTGLIKPGLERMHQALEYFPSLSPVAQTAQTEKKPHRILIGGTNGKGSTAGMLFHLMAASGFKVGLYTSPHLCHFSERIQVSGMELNDGSLLQDVMAMQDILPTDLYDEMSFFEITTLLAGFVFAKQNCEVEIYEVGLGGRWDSTNALDPQISAIVSIDYDHQQWLGDSLAEIADDKLCIARRGRPLFWAEQCLGPDKKELKLQLQSRMKQDGFELIDLSESTHWASGDQFSYHKTEGLEIEVRLPEVLQSYSPIIRQNFALSYLLFSRICADLLPEEKQEDVLSTALAKFGAEGVHWPPSLVGRFQPLNVTNSANQQTYPLLVDVCHNIAAAQQFAESLRKKYNLSAGERCPGIISIVQDKDIIALVEILRSVLDPLVVFKIDNNRSLKQEDLGSQNQDLLFFENFSQAWIHALKNFPLSQNPWVMCGSFFTVGEVFNYFGAFPEKPQMQTVLHGNFTFTDLK